MHFYIYLEIVALNLSIGSILKNAVFLVFLGVKRNFIALIINLVIISLIVLFLPFSVFAVILIAGVPFRIKKSVCSEFTKTVALYL